MAEYVEQTALTVDEKVSTKYRKPTSTTDAILVVEKEELHVNKCILSVASPVFRKMFGGDHAKTPKVQLDNKKLVEIEWLLDYMYPDVRIELTDEKALKLALLADEYQLTILKEDCVEVLMRMENPRLEIVTVAQLCDHTEFLDKAIETCARVLPVESHLVRTTKPRSCAIDYQQKLPENELLSKDNIIRIYREKLRSANALH